MGSIFILNDSKQKIYWKTNIYRIEKFIIYESVSLIILTFMALLSFPFDSMNLVNQKISINNLLYIIFFFSFVSLFFSLLIKNIHMENKIKPNYRLCLMNFYGYFGFFSFITTFFISFYITFVIIEWEGIQGIIANRILATQKKIVISTGTAIYTLIWNNFIILCTIFGIVDFGVEIFIISKASKFLSEGNNINNSNLLFELFKIPIINNINKRIGQNFCLANSTIDKRNKYKLRLIISNNDNNYFENDNNKFREVEIIQKIEYNSIEVQTESFDNIFYDNYIQRNKNKSFDEDFSNNNILVKNKSLIDSKSTFNDILNAPIK